MAASQETGHAKNVANLQDLIAFATSYGATYNPSKTSLKLAELNNLVATAKTALDEVVNKNTEYNTKVNARVAAFEGLKALSTRLINALQTTDAAKETIEDAKGFNRKAQGKRASAIETPTDPNAPAPNTISTSQQSYEQQILHFTGLISVLQSEPSYKPNEVDLQLATLTAKQQELSDKNMAVAIAYTAISNARIARDKILYAPNTGLTDVANDVKKYIKSIFGASSPEYAQVSGIEFKTVKK